jgi:hypothetical protein
MSKSIGSCFVLCHYVPPSTTPRYATLDAQLVPGNTVFVEDLAAQGVLPCDLEQLPLPALIMCLRSGGYAPHTFNVNMLRQLDAEFRTPSLLFGPWVNDFTPMYCAFIGLTMDVLMADGLTADHVRELYWPARQWHELFCMTGNHMRTLGVTREPNEFFSSLSTALCLPDASGEAPLKLRL